METEFDLLMAEAMGGGDAFGHREHIHLAWLLVRRYGVERAAGQMGEGIRRVAEAAGQPQKFHVTMTRAWVELVGHHVDEEPGEADFESFAVRNPALFDKFLLGRFYRHETLASPGARAGWTAPDLAPFPWRG